MWQMGHVLTLRAETGMAWMSPPNSSQTTLWASSSCLTLWGSACGLSHLLIATITGTEMSQSADTTTLPTALSSDAQVQLTPLDFLACWMDSTVWFMTPSSAATTRMMMSVTLAPRALMEEKAAWPGVSRKVIFSPEGSWTGEETQSSLELKKLLRWLFSLNRT